MKNSMSDLLCHNCRSNLHKIFFEKNLKSVTSDCKPSLEGISLAACHNCGLIQKPITEKYLEEVKKIYNLYDIYAQGEGAEQLVFDIEEGALILCTTWPVAQHSNNVCKRTKSF